ncbi:MAG: hypothetical protein JOZ89_10195 [Gammaproteobacteria bacterium]|nr:hypothetical protein [Gammaproteobacteria bacterium]
MTFDTGDQPPNGDAAIYSPDNGQHWFGACTTTTGPSCLGGANGVGSRPGPLVINPTLLNTMKGVKGVTDGTYPTLYEFMGTNGNGTEVNISCDGGQTWSHVQTSSGMAGGTTNDFVAGAIDQGGNLYTAYTVANDPNPWRVWFARSTPKTGHPGDCTANVPGVEWSTPVALTGPPASSDHVMQTAVPAQSYAVMPWLVAGSPGRVDLVYYGTDTAPPFMPDSQASFWNLHMAQSTDGGVTWADEKASETPMHAKSICFSGLGCTTQQPPGGDRNLLDFFQVKLDSSGRAVIIYTDDNNTAACASTCSPGIGLISEVQQATGQSLFASANSGAGTVPPLTNALTQSLDVRQAGLNADVTRASGNAIVPSAGHNINGTEDPAADITDLKVCLTASTSCPVTNTATNTAAFLFTVKSLSGGPGSAVIAPNTGANWLVTWRANNDLWYAQATTGLTGTLSCTYGRPLSVYNDGEPKAAEYVGNPEAVHLPSSACVANTSNNTIEIDVPFDATSGITTTSVLYGLTGWTGNSSAALDPSVCSQAPGGNDCSGPIGFFTNVAETAPLDVSIGALPSSNTPESPVAPLLLGLGGVALAASAVIRRRRGTPPAV